MAFKYTSGAAPTAYMSFASWVGTTSWKSRQNLNEAQEAEAQGEYDKWRTGLSAATPTTTPTTTTPTTSQLETGGYTSLAGIENPTQEQLNAAGFGPKPPPTTAPPPGHPAYSDPNTPWYKPHSQLEVPQAPPISQLEVPQAPTLPPYKPTAELEALSSQVGGAISGIIEQGGIGIPKETKEALFLREAEIINANTAQANRNLEDKMAAQGLSNSGMAFSEGMKLASKSTIAMANVMRDVQIQDSLMKIASYQNALGLGVQFLSYLSEESWRQYQPTLYQWQAQVDMYKLAIVQAYTQNNMAIQQAYTQGNMALAQYYEQQNMTLANKYDMEMAQFTAQTNIQLAQMTIDAAAKAADKNTFWEIVGGFLGFLGKIALAWLT